MSHDHSVYGRAKKSYSNWRCRSEGRAYIAILFSMNEGRCPDCGKEMYLYFGESKRGVPELNRATLDHVTPLKVTRAHDKNNLRLCCYECNKDKGSEDIAYKYGKYSTPAATDEKGVE